MEPPAVLQLDGSFYLTLVAGSDNSSTGDLRVFAGLLFK
jgi:hypothetical protein